MRVAWSYQRMPMVSMRSTSRSLSPTSSTMAWNDSEPAIPCWMLLITASSALRRSVSLSRRCVSANRRAFSSATPMLAATVVSRRTSGSPKAPSRSWFSTTSAPTARVLPRIGRPMHERHWSVPCTRVNPIGSSSARVRTTSTSRPWRIRHIALPGRKRTGGGLSRTSCSYDIRHLDLVALAVPPEDGQVAHAEDRAKLVADQVDDREEVELGDQPLLDAVDHRQLGVALLDLLGLMHGGEPGGVRDGRLLGERRDQVAVGGVEPARRAVDVDVEGAEQHAPVEQRRDDARALLDGRRALRTVAQARAAAAPRLVDPGRDRRAQLGGVFTGGQLRGGDAETFGAVEQEQDTARPRQRGDALDQLPVPRRVGRAAGVTPIGRRDGRRRHAARAVAARRPMCAAAARFACSASACSSDQA